MSDADNGEHLDSLIHDDWTLAKKIRNSSMTLRDMVEDTLKRLEAERARLEKDLPAARSPEEKASIKKRQSWVYRQLRLYRPMLAKLDDNLEAARPDWERARSTYAELRFAGKRDT